eukprot:NODE_850_length_3705_cov_0.234609.p1 type:complete len:411 gc:universal NODE_850_length_3705_cov_0.234609:2428-3660(+)
MSFIPNLSLPVSTETSDGDAGLYESIRLYRGIISSKNYLLCDICHACSLEFFKKRIQKYGHNMAAAIRLVKNVEMVCFPRLPHLYLSNSVYSPDLSEVDVLDFETYLEQVRILSQKYVDRISSVGDNTCFKNIERYYGSIYTHAIAWQLSTKELQIKYRNYSSIWPSVLEKAITRLKGNETYGISCGLIATHDIAEAFLTFIDNKLYAALNATFPRKKFRCTRRMDTFCFQSFDISHVDFTEVFEDVIQEFNLLPSKKQLVIDNYLSKDFKLREYLLNEDFNKDYLLGPFDQDLICLLLFKKTRDTGYVVHLEEFEPCLQHCAQVIPFIVEYLINYYQAIVQNSEENNAIINLAEFIIANCKNLSKRSIQHLAIRWLDIACDIRSEYLIDHKITSPPAALLSIWDIKYKN